MEKYSKNSDENGASSVAVCCRA